MVLIRIACLPKLCVLVLMSFSLILEACMSRHANFERVIMRRTQMQMGTIVALTVIAPNGGIAEKALDAAFWEIRRLEELLSTWLPNSEVSQLNQAAGLHPIHVSPDTLQILKRSLEVAGLTEGAFNIALAPALYAWNITAHRPRIPDLAELERLRPLLDWTRIKLDDAGGTAFLMDPHMLVDLGGIGKGVAADRAVAVMREIGAIAGIVSSSSDVKVFGRLPNAELFKVAIPHPRKQGAILGFVYPENEAISTAGDYERFFVHEGVRYHHIVDPRSLYPASGCQSVTVVAKEGWLADGLATGIFVMGPDQGMELIERLPDVEGLIVDSTGAPHLSSGLKGRFHPNPSGS